MPILPNDELVALQIGDVVVGVVGVQFKDQPPDVGVEEAFCDTVRIVVMIDMLMVTAMLTGPHQN